MARFYPLGRRALDGGNVDGQFCQIPLADYISHSNSERLLIFQIESPEALEKVEAIAAVPGFDVLLIGPGDFSHLIGHPGEMNHPEVIAARKRVGAAARKHGKYAMVPGLLAPRAVLEDEGYQIFNLGADVLGLAEYFKGKVAEFGEPRQRPAGSDFVPAHALASRVA
jgi:4-hydroxy-2-oxoheptanedioate aldolase